ncbi:hypothetical protein J4H86_11510 [Spiractinospora alimapuensis]|uniref:hypothetical protein n=1 Tax=Spiractinospora alimapuensis TaxID=2820884 RepID=UPI001F2DF383|nr:hypothetical protein [Spiractinospora alimapuensis]QVQ54252.1 hypothetical protein J4H86_11510 [Spiractinospora alimapuensis]
MEAWNEEDARAAAFTAIEEHLTGRLEAVQSAVCRARLSSGGDDPSGRALEEVRARDLAAWQEQGYLSHLNAAAVAGRYYERRISQAARALQKERARTGSRKARLLSEFHRLRHERAAVHAWLVAHGWDPDLERVAAGDDWEVAGHCWMSG